MFERLANIFRNDRANGNAAEVPVDMVEEQSNNEDEVDLENDISPMSVSKEGSQHSQVSQKKEEKK